MAYLSKDLSVLAYANNFTLWHYTTTDIAVTGGGYFNAAASMLRVNDLIIANLAAQSGTPTTVFYIVTGNTGTNVTVAAFVA